MEFPIIVYSTIVKLQLSHSYMELCHLAGTSVGNSEKTATRSCREPSETHISLSLKGPSTSQVSVRELVGETASKQDTARPPTGKQSALVMRSVETHTYLNS